MSTGAGTPLFTQLTAERGLTLAEAEVQHYQTNSSFVMLPIMDRI
jgi:hypothetical protein